METNNIRHLCIDFANFLFSEAIYYLKQNEENSINSKKNQINDA